MRKSKRTPLSIDLQKAAQSVTKWQRSRLYHLGEKSPRFHKSFMQDFVFASPPLHHLPELSQGWLTKICAKYWHKQAFSLLRAGNQTFHLRKVPFTPLTRYLCLSLPSSSICDLNLLSESDVSTSKTLTATSMSWLGFFPRTFSGQCITGKTPR
jgi:hypothetical protein